jgi:serine/threonine protein kinase
MSEQPVGAEIAGYRIESVIGRGGMAVVYRAEDTRLGRKVALKLLTPSLSDQHQFQQRFIQESRLAASLDHPNIIPIYQAGNADGLLFIAMRYVVGPDLKAALSGDTRLTPSRTLRLIEQIGDALDAAHELGLVHRDVKPGNVLLTSVHEKSDHVYLTDFGLTKRASSLTGGLTGTGNFLGTIDYVAPEQIAGKPVDAHTDMYALGCLLFECLTGQVPFHRDDDAATLWAHLVDMPPPVTAARSDLSPAVDAVIGRAMAKAPEDRYDSCQELTRELKGALDVATPVRGGRTLGGVDTSPPWRRADVEYDQETRTPVELPSFRPRPFPSGWRPSGVQIPVEETDAPELEAADAQEYAEPEGQPYADLAEMPVADDVDGDGLAGLAGGAEPGMGQPRRSFLRRRKWPLLAVTAALVGLAVAAAVVLLPSKAPPKLSGHYRSNQQFNGVAPRFVVDTPSDWLPVDDPIGVDVALSPAGQTSAALLALAGQGGSWDPVLALLKTNRSKATGAWIHAQQDVPDRSSWQKLQTAVRDQLPTKVLFDGGYRARTVGGMAADEMDGHFEDPNDASASLRFVIDVVQYRTPALTSSVWLVFFAAPDKFSGQQSLFDRVRDSITFL